MSDTSIGVNADTVEFATARLRGLAARFEAQKIAYGPVVFQCIRIAWKSGLLEKLDQAGKAGASIEELAHQPLEGAPLPTYAITVLLETALSAGVVRREKGRYSLTRIGDNVLHDEMTQININYVHDVCYQGLFVLDACLREKKPLGLKSLGDWSTIYEGLSELPDPARASWFDFDHHYSGSAFSQALPHVFASKPRHLMDIGANTGKWAMQCLHYDTEAHITLVDLPSQLALARETLAAAGFLNRVSFCPIDILDDTALFPAGVDAVWMSQFLTCFSIEAIDHIFRRAADCLAEGGFVWVLDTFWDRQSHDIARYCLINTSPYFTAIASGNSKMYESNTIITCAETHGLRLSDTIDNLGISHSLLCFERVS